MQFFVCVSVDYSNMQQAKQEEEKVSTAWIRF